MCIHNPFCSTSMSASLLSQIHCFKTASRTDAGYWYNGVLYQTREDKVFQAITHRSTFLTLYLSSVFCTAAGAAMITIAVRKVPVNSQLYGFGIGFAIAAGSMILSILSIWRKAKCARMVRCPCCISEESIRVKLNSLYPVNQVMTLE